MKALLVSVTLILSLAACGGGIKSADTPGTVVDTAKRSVTVKLDSGKTVTYATSKKEARRCRKAPPPRRWPNCKAAF